jgi:ABC-type Fe3+-siderophore transport system permease subunit
MKFLKFIVEKMKFLKFIIESGITSLFCCLCGIYSAIYAFNDHSYWCLLHAFCGGACLIIAIYFFSRYRSNREFDRICEELDRKHNETS